jgi:hypothetical protein
MPAFEGLRVLRAYEVDHPDDEISDIVTIVRRVEPSVASFDLDAALVLDGIVPKTAPHDGVMFYRECLGSVLLVEVPEWAKLMTLGRGRFIKRLKSEDFRDIRSLFRQARLLDEPASSEDIRWWDDIQGRVRLHHDSQKLARARAAELLTMELERSRMSDAGLELEPRWMAIEDNTVGYDVLSYTAGPFGPVSKLIEVKSTIASPLRFYVTRNEWEQAFQVGQAYQFQIWDLQKSPPALYERSVGDVEPHIPSDSGLGRWASVLIPVGN